MITCVLLLWFAAAEAKKYAVLISAGETTEDDAMFNSEFWYDLVLTYRMLIDNGYSHEDVWVLYGDGREDIL